MFYVKSPAHQILDLTRNKPKNLRVPGLGHRGLELKLKKEDKYIAAEMYLIFSECNFSTMLISRKARTTQNLMNCLGILLHYLAFGKFKFECYLAPQKCTKSKVAPCSVQLTKSNILNF